MIDMSYTPIPFENKPSTATPVSADNLNYMQNGIVLAVDRSRVLDEAWKDGSLKGSKGDQGIQGERGIQGVQGIQGAKGDAGAKGDKGDTGATGLRGESGQDGTSFHIDGTVTLLADLPDPTTVPNQWWVSYEFGHLHHSDGVIWHDVAQFVGIEGKQGIQGIQGERGLKGDKGDKGERGEQGVQGEHGIDGVFEVDAITSEQLAALHAKLYELNDNHHWSYQTFIDIGKTARFKVADLNLDLAINRNSATVINYRFFPNDTAKSALYYVNRLSNYDLVAWESTVTTGYKAQAIAASGFVLDASGYLPGREYTKIEVIDPVNNMWYSIHFIGLGEGTMFIDVRKRVNSKRQIVTAN